MKITMLNTIRFHRAKQLELAERQKTSVERKSRSIQSLQVLVASKIRNHEREIILERTKIVREQAAKEMKVLKLLTGPLPVPILFPPSEGHYLDSNLDPK